jgi:hypothetical protein
MTTLIVFVSPGIDDLFRFGQCLEPVRVQARCAEGSIERFDEGVVGRLTDKLLDALSGTKSSAEPTGIGALHPRARHAARTVRCAIHRMTAA